MDWFSVRAGVVEISASGQTAVLAVLATMVILAWLRKA